MITYSIGTLAVDFNILTAQPIIIVFPIPYTRAVIRTITLTNPSIRLNNAKGTLKSAQGTNILDSNAAMFDMASFQTYFSKDLIIDSTWFSEGVTIQAANGPFVLQLDTVQGVAATGQVTLHGDYFP